MLAIRRLLLVPNDASLWVVRALGRKQGWAGLSWGSTGKLLDFCVEVELFSWSTWKIVPSVNSSHSCAFWVPQNQPASSALLLNDYIASLLWNKSENTQHIVTHSTSKWDYLPKVRSTHARVCVWNSHWNASIFFSSLDLKWKYFLKWHGTHVRRGLLEIRVFLANFHLEFLLYKSFSFFLFFGWTRSMWKFLG